MNEMEWAPISGQCLIYVLCGIVEVEAYDSLLVCPSGSSHSMMMVMGLKADVIAMWQCSLSSQWNMSWCGRVTAKDCPADRCVCFGAKFDSFSGSFPASESRNMYNRTFPGLVFSFADVMRVPLCLSDCSYV